MPEEKKEKHEPWWMLRNSRGKKDVALTLMVAAFILTCILTLAGAVSVIQVGTLALEIRSLDMGFTSTVLVPLIMLYFGNRYSDKLPLARDTQALWSEVEKLKASTKKKVLTEESTTEEEGA